MLGLPRLLSVGEGDPQAGRGWQPPDEGAEFTPRQVAGEETLQADAVLRPEVGFDGLPVLPQEPSEAGDSPAVMPQCFW